MNGPIRLLIALIAVIVSAGLASCGGSDEERDPPDEPPAKLLAEAFANPVSSGDATIAVELGLVGDSPFAGLAAAQLDGPFEADPDGGLPSFDLGLDAEVAGYGVDGQIVSTDEDVFVVFFGENYRVGTERVAQIDEQLRTMHADGSAAPADAASWFLRPRYAGNEDVLGAEAVRIESGLDTPAAAAELAPLLGGLGAPPLVSALAEGARRGEAEAWIAYDDTTLRRLRLEFPFRVPAELLAQTSGIRAGEVALEVTVGDVGGEVEIERPPGGGFQPIDQLIDRITSLVGLAF